MGKLKFSVNTIFINRPRMKHYPLLTPEVKEIVDYTIAENLKENPIVRRKRFIGFKKIKPKKSDLWFLSWREIIGLREAVKDQNIYEIMKVMYNLNSRKIGELDIFNCFAAYTWIKAEMVKIHEIEMNMLYEKPTDEEKDAGVEKLQEFGYAVALRNLTKGDKTKENYYLSLPYAEIFRELCLNKVENEIQKTHHENASRKIQRNNRG